MPQVRHPPLSSCCLRPSQVPAHGQAGTVVQVVRGRRDTGFRPALEMGVATTVTLRGGGWGWCGGAVMVFWGGGGCKLSKKFYNGV